MTEIAPGMMVECIQGNNSGKRYFVTDVIEAQCLPFYRCKGKCTKALILQNTPNTNDGYEGWALHCFKPIGGDKEIEKEKFQKLDKATQILSSCKYVRSDLLEKQNAHK